MTIEEITNLFLEFEHTNNLHSLELNGIKIWGFMRYWFHYCLISSASGISIPMQSQKKNNWFKNFFKAVRYSLYSKQPKQSDILYIPHPRRVKQENGNYYCLYTDFIKGELDEKYSSFVLEEPYWAEYIGSSVSHYRPAPYDNIYYIDMFDIKYLLKKFFITKFKKKIYRDTKILLENIVEKFNKQFGTNIQPDKSLVFDWLLYLQLMLPRYEKLFDKIKPRLVIQFRCAAMFRSIMTYIANNRGVPVIEMQHGLYSAENLYYKFYKRGKYSPLPDYVFTFGDVFFDKHYLPYSNPEKHVIPTGFLFLERKSKQYMAQTRQNSTRNILIISQGSLNKDLRKFARELAELILPEDNLHIIYKKHPYEKEAVYSDLEHPNITIVGSNEHDIYFYFAQSYCQIGAYSTAIYEGIRFMLPTFIIKGLHCSDQTKRILGQDRGIYYINNAKETYKQLANGICKPSQKLQNRLWHPIDILQIKQNINNILHNHTEETK